MSEYRPPNRVEKFFPPEPPASESSLDDILQAVAVRKGSVKISYAMVVIDGQPALRFKFTGAIKGEPDDLFELMHQFDEINGKRKGGAK